MRGMDSGNALREPRAAIASSIVAAYISLGACAALPLSPYSTDTPPLVLVPPPQAGVQDRRGRFREIYCAVLERPEPDLPDSRRCADALTPVGIVPDARAWTVDLGSSQRHLVAALVPGIGYECFEPWLNPPGTVQ